MSSTDCMLAFRPPGRCSAPAAAWMEEHARQPMHSMWARRREVRAVKEHGARSRSHSSTASASQHVVPSISCMVKECASARVYGEAGNCVGVVTCVMCL